MEASLEASPLGRSEAPYKASLRDSMAESLAGPVLAFLLRASWRRRSSQCCWDEDFFFGKRSWGRRLREMGLIRMAKRSRQLHEEASVFTNHLKLGFFSFVPVPGNLQKTGNRHTQVWHCGRINSYMKLTFLLTSWNIALVCHRTFTDFTDHTNTFFFVTKDYNSSRFGVIDNYSFGTDKHTDRQTD